MSTVDIFYTHFTQPSVQWDFYLQQLPDHHQQKINRYRRWQDRQASLFSYLLLRKILVERGYATTCLTQLQYEERGRPFIDKFIDFNLSHSGDYVVCAVASQLRLGIDIELIRPIAVADFKNCMTVAQWDEIMQSVVPHEKFFDHWTIKESVMKADGRGLWIPLVDIQTQENQAIVYEKIWFIQKILIAPTYACHLAIDKEDFQIQIHAVTF